MDAITAGLIDAEDAEYDWADHSADVIEFCAQNGLVCDIPADDVLQIDLDTREDWARFKRSWEILSREWELGLDVLIVSKSRRKEDGRHVRVTLPHSLTPLARIALQAALGSDPVRELLSFLRLRSGDPRPTLFIEKPGYDAPLEPAEFLF